MHAPWKQPIVSWINNILMTRIRVLTLVWRRHMQGQEKVNRPTILFCGWSTPERFTCLRWYPRIPGCPMHGPTVFCTPYIYICLPKPVRVILLCVLRWETPGRYIGHPHKNWRVRNVSDCQWWCVCMGGPIPEKDNRFLHRRGVLGGCHLITLCT